MKKASVVDEFRSWVDWTSRNLPQLPTIPAVSHGALDVPWMRVY